MIIIVPVLIAWVVSDPTVVRCAKPGPTRLGLWLDGVGDSATGQWARQERKRR